MMMVCSFVATFLVYNSRPHIVMSIQFDFYTKHQTKVIQCSQFLCMLQRAYYHGECIPCSSYCLVLSIGFFQAEYEVSEELGSVSVVFGVLEGTIDRTIEVSFDFASGTAIGQFC